MENYLYYAYLNWNSKNSKGFFRKIKNIPITAIILTLLLVISTATFIFLVIFSREYSLFPFIAISALLFISFFYLESFQSKNYKGILENYKSKCETLKNEFEIITEGKLDKDKLEEYRNRILVKVSANKEQINKLINCIIRVMQALFIPITLSLINNQISNVVDPNQLVISIITICLTLGFLFLTIIGIIYFCYSAVLYKNTQYIEFANVLQDIIDIYYC